MEGGEGRGLIRGFTVIKKDVHRKLQKLPQILSCFPALNQSNTKIEKIKSY